MVDGHTAVNAIGFTLHSVNSIARDVADAKNIVDEDPLSVCLDVDIEAGISGTDACESYGSIISSGHSVGSMAGAATVSPVRGAVAAGLMKCMSVLDSGVAQRKA